MSFEILFPRGRLPQPPTGYHRPTGQPEDSTHPQFERNRGAFTPAGCRLCGRAANQAQRPKVRTGAEFQNSLPQCMQRTMQQYMAIGGIPREPWSRPWALRSDRWNSRDRNGLVIGSLGAGRSLTPRAHPRSRRTGESIAPYGGSRMSTCRACLRDRIYRD